MVGSIIYHDYCTRSPLPINAVEVIAQFDQEQHEGITVVLSTVDSEHKLAVATHRSYNTESSQPLHSSSHVPLPSFAPPPLSFISLIKNTFVNVDNNLTFRHELDVISCCHLPLQLSLLLIVHHTDWLHFPVR